MRRLLRRVLFPSITSVAAVALAIACGVDATSIPDPDGADGSSPPDGADASAQETSTPDAGVDANVVCPDVLPDDAAGAYVAMTGANGPSCGTRSAPCATVSAGIARALAATPTRSKVYVARGTYSGKVTLSAGIAIIGGWDIKGTTWKRACVSPRDIVVLRAPASSNVTVEATNLGGEAALSLLTIQSKPDTQVSPGQSLYGVTAVGATTTLVMNDVRIDVGAAGPGAAGSKGDAGAPGAASCAAGTGAAGGAGTQGAGAGAGAFDVAGYAAAAATTGGVATRGGNGTAGGAGTCVACGTCGAPPLCDFIPNIEPKTCGKDGTPGCAGGPGDPGGPATGGGSSIGVYAWDAKITITGGRIKSGNAGNGGLGGAGGPAGASTKGAAGAPATACVTACAPDVMAVACVETKSAAAGGAAGEAGGASGTGGAGGGGGGGSSFAIYQGGTGVVTTAGGTALLHGNAGSGGGPVAGAGAPGAAANRVP